MAGTEVESGVEQQWIIERLWSGEPARQAERVQLSFRLESQSLHVHVQAPHHGDRAPAGPPGAFPGLWDYEVVELFLLAEPDHYLEIELGPHGHHWVLELHGRRQVAREGLPIRYQAQRADGRWTGRAEIPRDYLPAKVVRGNGYAIHGTGAPRRYLARFPVAGTAPDFHRLDCFGPLG